MREEEIMRFKSGVARAGRKDVVRLILTAEIEVEHRKGQDPKMLARLKLDQFREAVQPSSEYGITFFEEPRRVYGNRPGVSTK